MKKINKILSFYIAKAKIKFMNQGLRFRLLIGFGLVSLLPLLVLGVFSYYKSTESIKEITGKYSSDIINETNTNMLMEFKNIDKIGSILLNNNTVKDILSQNDENAMAAFDEDKSRMESLLRMIHDSNNYIRSVYILSNKNTHIFAVGEVTEDRGLVFFNDEYRRNYKESLMYTQTVDGERNYIWWPTQNVLGQNVFILTERLYDEKLGILGVLVVHISVEIMDDIYSRIKPGKNSELYLLDEDGRILFHPNKINIGKQFINSKLQSEFNSNREGSVILHEGPNPLFIVYNTYADTQWKAVVATPYNEIVADAENIRYATLIILVVCLLIIIILSIFISKSISNPIYKLTQLMKKGSSGDMNVKFNVLYNDEIGQLANSFNTMMGDIEKLIKLVETESKQKVEAEIKALEAHINPHFLYNTLASIYWNAMSNGNVVIGKMAHSLSNFFRLGLNKGKQLTTVEKEVEHVKEYLSIQKMLYNDIFNYEIITDPKALEYQTIKLILQPLVENSLIHGFEKMKDGGMVTVEIRKDSDDIIYSVRDNGKGIEDLNKRGIEEIINNGFGLKNIKQRLQLYFNNDFTIQCTSIPNIETLFIIKIPVLTIEEDKQCTNF